MSLVLRKRLGGICQRQIELKRHSIRAKAHADVQLKTGAHSLGSCLHWPTLFAEQQRLLVATPSTPVSRSLLLCNQQNTSQTKQCHPPSDPSISH